MAPFVRGGAEVLAESLVERLVAAGHQAVIVSIPFKWYPACNIPRHILACRLFKYRPQPVDPDLVIALKFPAYCMPFENKKVWLLHQFRQAYELWGTEFDELSDSPEGRQIRSMIMAADNVYLREARAIYTNSKIVAQRLKTWNRIETTKVLYPPLHHPEDFSGGPSGDYFFYPSRLVESKRQALAIEAMRHVRSPFRLVVAGSPDNDRYERYLESLIEKYDLQNKVTMLGWISERQKADLMSNCLAVLYLPFDEDSYGYVTLEAYQSRKPVLTLKDSGGTEELVEDGVNGRVVGPSPEELAWAMEEMWAKQEAVTTMGQAGFETIGKKGITWDHIIDELTSN